MVVSQEGVERTVVFPEVIFVDEHFQCGDALFAFAQTTLLFWVVEPLFIFDHLRCEISIELERRPEVAVNLRFEDQRNH